MSLLRELGQNKRQGRRVSSDVPEPSRPQVRGRRRGEAPGADHVSDVNQPLEVRTFDPTTYHPEPRQTQSLTSWTRGVPLQPAPLTSRLVGQQPPVRNPLRHQPQQQQQHRVQSRSRGQGYVAHDPFRATAGQDDEAVEGKTTWDDIEARRPQTSSRPASAGSRYGRPDVPLRAPPRRPVAPQDPASLVAIVEEESVSSASDRHSFARRRRSLSPLPEPAPRRSGIPARPSIDLSDVVVQIAETQGGAKSRPGSSSPPPISPQYYAVSASQEALPAPSSPVPVSLLSYTDTSRGRRPHSPAKRAYSPRPSSPGRRAYSPGRRPYSPPYSPGRRHYSPSSLRSSYERHGCRRGSPCFPGRVHDNHNPYRARSRSRTRIRERRHSRPSTSIRDEPRRHRPRSRSQSRKPEHWQAEHVVEVKVDDPHPRVAEAVQLTLVKEQGQSEFDLFKYEKGSELLSPTPTAEVPLQDVEAASVPQKRASTLEWLMEYSTKGIPRDAYNYFLLRLPSLYFSRVARIFEEADLSLGEIKEMVLESASKSKAMHVDVFFMESHSATSPAYDSLKRTWEGFIDSVMREWKTFNIISVLLLSAILTILQIDAAAKDAVTRYTALASLICALMSLLYGCMYIIRFGTMRKPYKAAEWALEAKKSGTSIFWNVWVLLAMPAVWLSWSLILYICCIMSFVWRTNTFEVDPYPLSSPQLLATRILITSILLLGVVYGSLIIATFARYGDAMDQAWKKRINGWIEAKYTETIVDEPESMHEPLKPIYGRGVDIPPMPVPYPPSLRSLVEKQKRKDSIEELEEEVHMYGQLAPPLGSSVPRAPDNRIPRSHVEDIGPLPSTHEINSGYLRGFSTIRTPNDSLPEQTRSRSPSPPHFSPGSFSVKVICVYPLQSRSPSPQSVICVYPARSRSPSPQSSSHGAPRLSTSRQHHPQDDNEYVFHHVPS